MIRQAINCDMCGTEKLESASHWFVADEQGGELRMRAWGASKGARKSSKHLCGQKCVQRLMDNFTTSILADLHAGKGKEVVSEKMETMIQTAPAREQSPEEDLNDMPILERMGYDRETAAQIEADSWAGPARPKENSWGAAPRKSENDNFINAIRSKTQTARSFQRSA